VHQHAAPVGLAEVWPCRHSQLMPACAQRMSDCQQSRSMLSTIAATITGQHRDEKNAAALQEE
jgi:hypothetical protein